MFERNASDLNGPAHAGGDASEGRDLGTDPGRNSEGVARRVWPRAEGPTPSWDGFGKALASTVLRQLQAKDVVPPIAKALARSIGAIRDGGPSAEMGPLPETSRMDLVQPVPGTRSIADGSRELDRSPEPEPSTADPGTEPGRLPETSRSSRSGEFSRPDGAASASMNSGSFTRILPELVAGPARPLPNSFDEGPRVGVEQPPQPIPVESMGGGDGSVPVNPLAGIRVRGGMGSIGLDLPARDGSGGSVLAEGSDGVGDLAPRHRVDVFGAQATGTGGGEVLSRTDLPDFRVDPSSWGLNDAGPPETYGGSVPAAASRFGDRTPFAIDVGPARMAGDYELEAPPAGALPVAAGPSDPGGALGAFPQAHGEPGADMTRTNQLLQQLLDEMKKGRRGFLPPGAREVKPGR